MREEDVTLGPPRGQVNAACLGVESWGREEESAGGCGRGPGYT